MKVELAESAGFCFGVKRAIESAYSLAREHNGPVCTLGPIIHNEQVVRDLEKKGVFVIESPDDIRREEEAVVVIRSHGVPKSVVDSLTEKKIRFEDATCPFVKKIHTTVSGYCKKDYAIVIIGTASHPEVQGILGWADGKGTVIETKEEAEAFFLENIQKKGYDILAVNTICNATTTRQREAAKLASRSDAMLVIGGLQSSNSRKLYEICKNQCENTFFIQTVDDLRNISLGSFTSLGITAGASTPNNIIEMLEDSLVTIHNGEVVEGTVIGVKDNEIILNIGYKADGILTKNEYSNNTDVDLTAEVKPGDTLKVKDGEGQVLLTYKRLLQDKVNKIFEEAFENNQTLTGKVVAVLKGGLSVAYEEGRVFIPASLVSDIYEKDLTKYADQEIEFVLTEVNPHKRRIIGDRKQLIVAEKKKMREELMEKIEVGMMIEGTVKNLTDFGAFIDLGGADGLLHISEMSWGRVEDPKKLFKVGDKVNVMIKDISENKIALTLKLEDNNPWKNAADKYQVGTLITGKVARMTDFGAFVELEEGIDALLHVSQISIEHVEKPSDVLSVGQEITAKIVDFNEETKKISLSIKAVEIENKKTEEPEQAEEGEEVPEE